LHQRVLKKGIRIDASISDDEQEIGGKAFVTAKASIITQMVMQGRIEIAIRYLKKTVFENSTNWAI
jgi:hypothetical protein